MILPSLSVILILFNVVSTQPSKRLAVYLPAPPSPAQVAALLLNQALAYQICVIASGSLAAVQAIKGTKVTAPICVAPMIPRNIPVVLKASGCISSYEKGGSIGVACYNNAGITSTGSLINAPELYGPGDTFTIRSTNSSCSGIEQPFFLNGLVGITAGSTNIPDLLWNVNCKTGLMSQTESTHIFCSILTLSLFSALPTSCNSTLTISAFGL